MALPKDDKVRKQIKVFDGFFAYFPDAIAAVAQLSVLANDKHNPGEPLHWAKGKSTEQRNSQARHILDEAAEGPLARDEELGVLHAVENAWRAMAQVQTLADQGHNIFAVPPADALAYAQESGDNGKGVPGCATPTEVGMQRDPLPWPSLEGCNCSRCVEVSLLRTAARQRT